MNFTSPSLLGQYFILVLSSGKELLKLDEDVAMEPMQDWLRRRAHIPKRIALAVEEAARESLL